MMNRRTFLSAASAALTASQLRAAKDAPRRAAKVTPLFKSPEGHPNGLETVQEGFWIGEQTTDRAHLVDFNGKLLKTVDTESSNTSGIAYGGGYLWMAANGKAIGRAPKPTDADTGYVLQVDPNNGKTVSRHPIPNGGGGVHGLEYAEDALWMASHKFTRLAKVNPKDFSTIHSIPVPYGRSHGLAWDAPGLWCMFSNDRVILKLDGKDGSVLETITLAASDPDPHGMCMWKGHLYYCDAGIAPGGVDNKSKFAGWICRIDLA